MPVIRSLDLIAAYARNTGAALQVRLDFLEYQRSLIPFDIYLALDNAAGGENQLPVPGTAGVRWNELLMFTCRVRRVDSHPWSLNFRQPMMLSSQSKKILMAWSFTWTPAS
jgi:hypothetical protein